METKRIDICLITAAILILSTPILLNGKIIIQPTGSYARGIYLKSKIDCDRELCCGDIVSVSFQKEDLASRPNTYPMPKHLPWHSFIKIIYGVPGDLISVSNEGFFINGKYIGPVFKKDSKSRPLNRVMDGEYVLKKGFYVVSTPNPKSYGSHYFGPVHLSQLKRADPLWILPKDRKLLTQRSIMNRENERLALEATFKNAEIFDLLFDKTLTEIMVNPDKKLWVDRIGKGRVFTGTLIPPEKTEAIIRTAASYTGVVCHKEAPLLEADLVDFGYARFQGILPPVSLAPVICIRRKAILNFGLDELVRR